MATTSEILLKDPLSEVTRKERRTFLGISALGIIMVKTGLIPSKISALGIDFSPTDQKTLLHAVAVVVGYFLVAFIIYASSDFLAWRHELRAALRQRVEQDMKGGADWARQVDAAVNKILEGGFGTLINYWRFVTPVSFFRAAFEFVLPIVVGLYSIGCLLLH